MPDPRTPVVLCNACHAELTRAERHDWCERGGLCDGCHAHALLVAGVGRAFARASRIALAWRRDVADAAQREAAGHAFVLDRAALERAGDWTAPAATVPAEPASGALEDPYWQHWYPLHTVVRTPAGAKEFICTPRKAS